MKQVQLDQDIHTIYVQAKSFPDGITAAFDQLYAQVPPSRSQRYFGISHPDQTGKIGYKAAAEIKTGKEPIPVDLPTFTIPKGTYSSTLVAGYASNTEGITRAFDQLLKDPRLDPHGFCLEIYNDKDVICLVKLT